MTAVRLVGTLWLNMAFIDFLFMTVGELNAFVLWCVVIGGFLVLDEVYELRELKRCKECGKPIVPYRMMEHEECVPW